MKPNHLKSQLEAGRHAFGTTCTLGSPETVEIAAHAGFDWVLIDDQHGTFSKDAIRESIRAAQTTDAAPIVRCSASNSPGEIEWVLDQGAAGIVCPMVNTAEQAEQIARAAYYPPRGVRSVSAGRCVTHYGPDYHQHANDQALVLVMIEHVEGVDNIDRILGVDGVSGVKIGQGDLTLSLGGTLAGLAQGDVPGLDQAMQRVLEATLAAGKVPSTFCPTLADARRRADQGFTLISVDYEFNMMRRVMEDMASQLRVGR